ncbi:hypothetical protein [Actinokineospora bangkokensis]|uniref:Uncharacterized protein n=1 Tax=Actinokineospora bangkokensis TaxID=1193682 RepID=A0A1Q9LMH3_9PSEU|nr:hypothetical protein [Actinokineospora bangkokensis]OLR93199.1 hypothetical protein BJP25_17030 [Actinokineospora bangkokensis]
MAGFGRKLWVSVREWFDKQAEHCTSVFLPDPGGQPVRPNEGYLRVFFAEGFLEKARSWGSDRYPALHGGVSLTLLGGTPAFTTLARPPEKWDVPGAQLDFPMTTLLPYTGGVVEVEAALYEAASGGPLSTAVGLVGSLSSLMGPPLSVAASIADKVSDGLDAVMAATGDEPVLGLHASFTSEGTNVLRPGHHVLIAAPQHELRGTPAIESGRLVLRRGDHTDRLTGTDYLVIRVECQVERDDWRFPALDDLIRDAGEAYLRGQADVFAERRTQALVAAWTSADLVAADRKRVALLIKDELDSLDVLRPAARRVPTLADATLPARDDTRVRDLSLADLLS